MQPSLIDFSVSKLSKPSNSIAAEFDASFDDELQTDEGSIPLIRLDFDNRSFSAGGQPIGNTIEAYCLTVFQQRAYYVKPYNPDNIVEPDCSSVNMIEPNKGENPQSMICASCPQAEFGSSLTGIGQACRTQTHMVLLSPETFPPLGIGILVVPPTSIKEVYGSARKGGGFLARAKQFREPGEQPIGRYQLVWSDFMFDIKSSHLVLRATPRAAVKNMEEAKAIIAIAKGIKGKIDEFKGSAIGDDRSDEANG